MAFFHLFYDDDWLSQEGEESTLPRDKWNPEHSATIKELLATGERSPDDIMLVNCPHCHSWAFYNQGFTEWCEWCGKLAVGPETEDETISLTDYWIGEEPYI